MFCVLEEAVFAGLDPTEQTHDTPRFVIFHLKFGRQPECLLDF